MDFFRSQDIARRNTTRLVVLFLLSLISLIAITNLLILFVLGTFAETINAPLFQRVDWRLFAYVSVAILAVVGFGSLFKIVSLAGGGAKVAEMMQGRLILPGSEELHEQRILNVVEEMAIAAGTPVPPVYVLEEQGINAFAAGYSPADAVIGITRGAINTLSRDELQGVIAHEFSHILHGDMRLNIRLIGILHGIMVLGIMGYYLVRTTGHSRRSKDSSNIAVVGIGLMIIGYAGTFFGNLIKAAVSRQREFLADASAVQYTRNPDGIANALKRIGSSSEGSLLQNPATSEISHALFGEGVPRSFNALFATHPPLEQRIRRIQPNWDGSFEVSHTKAASEASTSGTAKTARRAPLTALTALALTDSLIAEAGRPQEANLAQAREILASIPDDLIKAAHNPFSARALVYCLLLDSDSDTRGKQLALLEERADPAVYDTLQQLLAEHSAIDETLRLSLANLCLPVLRQLSASQYESFRSNLDALMQADGRISLWEWVLQRVIVQPLDSVFMPEHRLRPQAHHALRHLASSCAVLLAFVVRAGRQQGQSAEQTYAQAMASLGLADEAMPAAERLSIDAINQALNALRGLKPLQKPAFLKACALAIAADGVAQTQELEVFRAIAASLDCPLPPIPLSDSPSS
ncbi:MAG: M48 family metallopeptidase [Pseudomonadales bacterium]|nr:M48 family metallopeptidase [Pseudomonadales bacterium]